VALKRLSTARGFFFFFSFPNPAPANGHKNVAVGGIEVRDKRKRIGTYFCVASQDECGSRRSNARSGRINHLVNTATQNRSHRLNLPRWRSNSKTTVNQKIEPAVAAASSRLGRP